MGREEEFEYERSRDAKMNARRQEQEAFEKRDRIVSGLVGEARKFLESDKVHCTKELLQAITKQLANRDGLEEYHIKGLKDVGDALIEKSGLLVACRALYEQLIA